MDVWRQKWTLDIIGDKWTCDIGYRIGQLTLETNGQQTLQTEMDTGDNLQLTLDTEMDIGDKLTVDIGYRNRHWRQMDN